MVYLGIHLLLSSQVWCATDVDVTWKQNMLLTKHRHWVIQRLN